MTIDRIKLNESKADVMLYPDVGQYSILDASGYESIYRSGLAVADENIDRILEVSAAAPPPPRKKKKADEIRVVKNVEVRGLHPPLASDIAKDYEKWIGHPYDVNEINDALERIARIDEVATVDVDVYPAGGGDSRNVNVTFTVEKRPPFEIGVEGYTSSFHERRWFGLNANARDIRSDGDAANVSLRLGNDEWGADAKYFTPLMNGGQWGFALSGRKDEYSPLEFGDYAVDRYAARVMYYRERMDDYRFGAGLAWEYAGSGDYDRAAWGPYLYFNRDTLDNVLVPTRGYSLNAQLWWNDADILVSRTNLTAYIPLRGKARLIASAGLETGERDNPAYRALLGNREELLGLAKHPVAGDQTAWARLGFGRDFYNSWWGALRGEVFASYGMVMEDWDVTDDAWEAGLALSVPGQFLMGRLALVYTGDGEWVVGFSLGAPKWTSSPLP
jgi:NTE family protein